MIARVFSSKIPHMPDITIIGIQSRNGIGYLAYCFVVVSRGNNAEGTDAVPHQIHMNGC
jgi:hypothetical protein